MFTFKRFDVDLNEFGSSSVTFAKESETFMEFNDSEDKLNGVAVRYIKSGAQQLDERYVKLLCPKCRRFFDKDVLKKYFFAFNGKVIVLLIEKF